MVVVLAVRAAVTIARVQSGPLIVGSQAAVTARERVVENSSCRDVGDGSHSCRGKVGALGRSGRGSKVLIADTCRNKSHDILHFKTFRMIGKQNNFEELSI